MKNQTEAIHHRDPRPPAPLVSRGKRPPIEPWIQLVTFLGAIACATVAFWPMPPSSRQLAARELRTIGAAERRANLAFLKIWRDLEQGGSPEIAASRIDRLVLPSCRIARVHAEAADHGPLAPYMPDRLAEFFRQREIAWTALSDALRHDDPIEAIHFRRAWKASDHLAQRIRANHAAHTKPNHPQ